MAPPGSKAGGRATAAPARRFKEPWEETRPPIIFFVILAFQGTVMFLLLRHFGIITFI